MSQKEDFCNQLDSLRSDVEQIEGLGKDQILRLQNALDDAKSAVLSSLDVQASHDLNDDLAAISGEEHPREVGNEHPTVAEQKVEELEDPQEPASQPASPQVVPVDPAAPATPQAPAQGPTEPVQPSEPARSEPPAAPQAG